MEPEIRCLARGIDTLVLNVSYADEGGQPVKQELAEGLQTELDTWQQTAKGKGEPVPTPWMFAGANLLIREHGARGQWRWLLYSDKLTLSISRGKLNSIIAQARLSSAFLWESGSLLDAIADVHLLLMHLFGTSLWLQVSEVHLCADITGWDIGLSDWQGSFVSRAASETGRLVEGSSEDRLGVGADVPRRRWKRVRTLEFGGHGSPISCSLYDKWAEIKEHSKKTWFYDLWRRNGWDGESEVWRVEFRFRRMFLHACGIERAYDLLPRCLDLWEYATGHVGGGPDGLPDGWLRYTLSWGDTNRSRWPVHPVWEAVQRAFQSLPDAGGLGPLVRQRVREVNVERGIAATAGYLSTLAAWYGEELAHPESDLSLVLSWLYDVAQDYLDAKGQDFQALVRHKRVLYQLDKHPTQDENTPSKR